VQKLESFGLLVSATVGMTGLLWLWWESFFGTPTWYITLVFDRFGEQWVEGVIFHALGGFVILSWLRRFSLNH